MAKSSSTSKVEKGKAASEDEEVIYIPIGPYKYKVTFGEVEAQTDWGIVVYDKQSMWIDNTGSVARTAVVALHEIYHAIGHEYEVFNGLTKEVEERIVNVLSLELINSLRGSPRMREIIMEGVEDG